jgi:endonuclease III
VYNAVMSTSPATATSSAQRKTVDVLSRLGRHYGRPEWHPSGRPLEELVSTILSQHTSDTNCERAFSSLRRAFPTWEQVAVADVDDVADAIRSGGLANMKAPRIQSVVSEVLASGLTERLGAMPLDEAKAALQSLPGVGPKTAACVLLFACGRPALPVDTHVYRVTCRVGLIDAHTSPEQAHGELEAMLPPGDVYAFHINVIRLGREICKARSPRCPVCPLASICNYARASHLVETRETD